MMGGYDDDDAHADDDDDADADADADADSIAMHIATPAAATHAISTPLPRNLPTPPHGQNTSHALQNLQYSHLRGAVGAG